MRVDSPQARNALTDAAELLRYNRASIEACQRNANNAKQTVKCKIMIRERNNDER